MSYTETYRDLCHGTDEKSAVSIIENGFEIRGSSSSWCGKGIYFYDIKKKAWWSAGRTCNCIKKQTGEKLKPAVIFADILNIQDNDIFDLRTEKDLMHFEEATKKLFGNYKIVFRDEEDETERKIKLRAMLISYYSDVFNKKLVIGTFRQRPQPKYEHAIEFSNSLDMIFGIETIYCVKDTDIIKNVRVGGKDNGKNGD